MADLTRKTANLVNLPTWSNPTTDTRDQLQLIIRLYKNDVIVAQSLFNISTLGYFTSYSPVAGADFDRIFIKHNGSKVDISIINMPFDGKKNQQIWFSAIALGTNPTTVGGLSFKDIMLNVGDSALPYEPYWQHSLRKLATATEAVENPLYSDGTAITSYTIKGNTVQNGTPTPDNPVDVNGVGVRTAQLFDYTTMVSAPKNAYLNDSGEDIANSNWSYTDYIPCDGTDFVLSSIGGFNPAICFYDSSKNFIFGQKYGTSSTSTKQSIFVSVPTTAKYIRFSYCYTSLMPQNIDALDNIMLNTGSTAKPFEPYGYKIPILNGQQTTNIYLGSTQATRQIRKYTFDGTQSIFNCVATTDSQNYCCVFRFSDIGMTDILDYNAYMTNIDYPVFISDKFVQKSDTKNRYYDNISDGEIGANSTSGQNRYIIFCVSGITTAEDYKQWFTEHPTTIYYILGTSTTAAVNEPLMKIGNYADTLSNATAIPTTEGANSITVDTTVQPSEFTATWTGWHDSSVKEWDGSDWQ